MLSLEINMYTLIDKDVVLRRFKPVNLKKLDVLCIMQHCIGDEITYHPLVYGRNHDHTKVHAICNGILYKPLIFNTHYRVRFSSF